MIPHNRPLITAEDRSAVDAVLASQWIAQGEETAALERDFDRLFGQGGSCATASGTASLFLALGGLGLGAASRVAVSTYACTALLDAILMAGAEPVPVDIREDDLNIDPEALGALPVRKRADAAIAVHTHGARADISGLRLRVGRLIEDCCQSLGGRHGRGLIGLEADAAVFSFYATKVVTGGQGGLLRSCHPEILDYARNFLSPTWGTAPSPRFNLRITDIQSALVRSQLRRLEEAVQRRLDIARAYREATPPYLLGRAVAPEEGRLIYRFVLRTESTTQRDRLAHHFLRAGVETSFLIQPHELLHRYLGLDPHRFPVAERVVDTTLSLPLYPALRNAEVDRVCEALHAAGSLA